MNRITIPGVEPMDETLQKALRDAEAHARHISKEKKGLAAAMVRLGKPVFRRGPKPKNRPTAHVRNMRVRAARAYTVQGKA